MNYLQQMGVSLIVIVSVILISSLCLVKIMDLLEEYTTLAVEDMIFVATLTLITILGVSLFFIGTFI